MSSVKTDKIGGDAQRPPEKCQTVQNNPRDQAFKIASAWSLMNFTPQTVTTRYNSRMHGNCSKLTYEERFWQKVEKTETCWIWTGARSGAGYAMFGGKSASHISFFFATGRWPEHGKFLLHRCDCPPCINPDHLVEGTQAENIRDAVEKGRMSRGEKNGMSQLTEEQVAEIRKDHALGMRQRDLMKKFSISRGNAWAIVHGKRWSGGESKQSAIDEMARSSLATIARRDGRSARRKVTDDQVAEIRKRRTTGEFHSSIADAFGISESLVALICAGKHR